jgi:aryl carrier-like protein
VVHPFRDDPLDIVYRTGDRGRYAADGAIDFLGRLDDQVKIRGVRIEPEEVAAILRQHPRVDDCMVLAREDTDGVNVLVAYVVSLAADRVQTAELTNYLQSRVPSVMVPSAFVVLDALPRMPNGKVDRRALKATHVSSESRTRTAVAPRTPVEHSLAEIWCRLLKLEWVGVYDNFFDLGGHSLMATQLVSQMRRTFGVELPLRSMMANPTIDALAVQVLEQKARASNVKALEELLTQLESAADDGAEASDG